MKKPTVRMGPQSGKIQRVKPRGDPLGELRVRSKPGLLQNRDPGMQSIQPPEKERFAQPGHVGTRPVKPRRA